MFAAELYQSLDPLGAPGIILGPVVCVDHEGMWRTTVFFSVGQIARKRSAMKSAVAPPGGETQPRFRRVGTMDSKGRQLGYRFQIVIQRLVCLSTLAAATQQADGYHSL